jgi:Astacin (Peptidase family M12A)
MLRNPLAALAIVTLTTLVDVVPFAAMVPELPPSMVRIDDMVFESRSTGAQAVGDRRALGASGFSPGASTPWTDGVIPLEFASGVTTAQVAQFYAACAEWTARANVTCRPRNGERQFALVTKNAGCFSYVGMTVTTPSIINLANNCWFGGTIGHELGHLLGLIHEHQRSDRDEYLTILWENVPAGAESQLAPIFNAEIKSPYDFESIMHYGFSTIGAPLRTLRAKPQFAAYDDSMGGGLPTALDGIALSTIYGPPTGSWPAPPLLQATMLTPSTVRLQWTRGVGGGVPERYSLVVGNLPSSNDFAVVPQGLNTVLDVAIPPGLPTLFVRALAANGAGQTESNEVSVTGPQPAPPKPILSGVTSRNPITIYWAVGSGAPVTSFVLHAGSRPGRSDIGVFPMGLERSISAVAPVGLPIYVHVVANGGGLSTASGTILVNVLPGTPSTPVMQPPVVTGTTVAFSWTPSAPVTGYTLRAVGPTGSPLIALVPVGNVSSISLPNVPAGSYLVSVSAQNGSVNSAYSNEVPLTVR